MADPKPSTADILAKIRAAKAAGGSEATPPPAEPVAPPPEAAPAADVPAAASAEPAAPAVPAEKPKSTADIMAAIKKGGGGAAAPAPAGGKPKSTADILAAARAGAAPKPAGEKPTGTANIMASIRGGGGGAGKPAAAPAAGDAAPKPAAAKAAPAAGDRPSVQEMLKAVKRAEAVETGGSAVAVATAPAKLKLPPKGAPGKAGAEVSRRSLPIALAVALMTPYYLGMSIMAVIGGIWSLGIARFMMPNTVLELPSKFKIGPESDYPFGKVSEKFKASRGVWIVNTDFEGAPAIYALSSVCTHLGCTPSWLEAEQKFKCPCHGSGFYITGVNFEGPAPRPLERVGLSLTPDGQLEVDKSRKFQEELGQWQDPKSFVRIV